MRGLAQTTGTQVYEAWTIARGGAPQPAGGFTVGANGIGVLDGLSASAADGVTIAVTLEPKPNPAAPTLPIISSGVATTPAS
jgi:anti-sigma-K factor RskA